MNERRAPQGAAARTGSAHGAHRLAPLFQPRSLAVIGASGRPFRPGHQAILALETIGFTGSVFPVTPTYDEIRGHRCFPSIEAVPGPVDLALIASASERMEAELAQCIRAGVRSALIFANALLESDSEPPILARVAAMAREADLPLLGPNTIGYTNYVHRTAGSWILAAGSTEPGPVALIIQSGSTYSFANTVEPRVRFSLTAQPGQEAVLTFADVADYALTLPETKVLGLFIETVRDADGFVRLLETARGRAVPVVVLKIGRTEAGARHVESHAGRLAGSAKAFDAVCRRHGAVLTESMDEWWSTLQLLSHVRELGPGGIAAVTDSGGQRALLSDHAEAIGVPWAEINEATKARLKKRLSYGLPATNPVDCWGGEADWVGVFSDCLEAVVEDPDAAIGVNFTDFGASDADKWPSGSAETCRRVARKVKKPIVAATFTSRHFYPEVVRSLVEDGIPVLDGGPTALKAIKNLFDFRDGRLRGTPEAPPALPSERLAHWRDCLSRDETLGEEASLSLLSDCGLPVIRSAAASNEDQAAAAARALGFPVVLKTAEGLAHKSEHRGVHLDLRYEAALRLAYRDLAARLGPQALVAAMAPKGIEIALGIVRDPQFGPLVMVGAGGELVEILDDHAFALAPIGAGEARRLIETLRVARLLGGVRGRPAADLGALAEAVARLSALGAALADLIEEIDVNPVIVHNQGCVAVDALVTVKPMPGKRGRMS
ncbi:MAG: acetate--CoA ligase family protein [Alphaproteobacteria bacterium]